MKRQYAKEITKRLTQSAKMGNTKGDLDAITELLTNINIPQDFNKPTITLPYDSKFDIYCEDPGMVHTISPRRIIINRNINHHPQRFFKEYLSRISKVFGYSTSSMLASAEGNKEVVEAIRNSEIPFSLLSRLRTVDYESESGKEEITDGPVITIVNLERRAIDEWQMNQNYEFKRNFLNLFLSPE